MSDAISKAVALNKKLAASLMVRKDELEAQIASARAAGRGVETLSAELATTEQDLALALKEIDELRRMHERGGTPSAAGIAALAESDSIAVSAEDRALERAREGINEIDAEAGLTSAPVVASEQPRQLTKEEADAKALAEFEALRGGQSTKPLKKTM